MSWQSWAVKWVRRLLLGYYFTFWGSFAGDHQGFHWQPALNTTYPQGKESSPSSLPFLKIMIDSEGESFKLSFDWTDEKPALAIVKGIGKWWIVLNKYYKVSLPNLKERPIPGLLELDTITVKEGIVLQVRCENDWVPQIKEVSNKFEFFFSPHPLKVHQKATLQLPSAPKEALAIILQTTGQEIRFKDPETGYMTVVFPSSIPGAGVDEGYLFPDVCIMASLQGIGIHLLKDDLILKPTAKQITIAHQNGLAITLQKDREKERPKPTPIGFFIEAKGLDWVDRQEKINESLLDLPHDQHGPGELELAWLLLGQGQAIESLGYLTHLAQMRPTMTHVPLFQMLYGLGCLILNRLQDAKDHLSSIGEEPEAQIWLFLLKAKQYPAQVTTEQFHLSFQQCYKMLQNYPKPLRHQMMTFLLMAAIAVKDLEALTTLVNQETCPENLMGAEAFHLAKAKVLMNQNKPDPAFQILEELMEKAISPDIRAIAHFDYIKCRWETNMIKEKEARQQLEPLRTRWQNKWLGNDIQDYLDKRTKEN